MNCFHKSQPHNSITTSPDQPKKKLVDTNTYYNWYEKLFKTLIPKNW